MSIFIYFWDFLVQGFLRVSISFKGIFKWKILTNFEFFGKFWNYKAYIAYVLYVRMYRLSWAWLGVSHQWTRVILSWSRNQLNTTDTLSLELVDWLTAHTIYVLLFEIKISPTETGLRTYLYSRVRVIIFYILDDTYFGDLPQSFWAKGKNQWKAEKIKK